MLRPRLTAEVSAICKLADERKIALVPQGGNTGLVGGGVPEPDSGAVVLSLARLTALEPVDPVEAQVTAGAGVTLERLQAHAREAGLDDESIESLLRITLRAASEEETA